jgi:pentatricopeptide repeat protein
MLRNVLVDMYIRCGAIAEAHQVHDALPSRDVVSWNSLIAGYAEDGQGSEALSCFHRMQKEGLSPNIITFVCLLKACSSIEAMTEGEKIHCQIMNERLLEDKDPRLATTLLDMYAKCSNLERAQQVLDSLHVQDVISWNALIVGYNKQGKGEDALSCFDRMLNDCILPSETTLSCMLKACGNAGAVGKGKRFHKEIVDKELFHKHAILSEMLW